MSVHTDIKERRVRGEAIVNQFSSKENEKTDDPLDGLRSDVSDMIADLLHFAEGRGLDTSDVMEAAENAYHSDLHG